MSIAQNIKTLRTENHLSQDEFGQRIGSAKTSVSQWETGKITPRATKLQQIADCFNVSIESLTDGGEQKATKKTGRKSKNHDKAIQAITTLKLSNPNLFSAEMNAAIEFAINTLEKMM